MPPCPAISEATRSASSFPTAYVIVGEPTGGKYVRAGKGTYKARLAARGVAGHSSQNVGPSAVHEIIGVAHRLLAHGWGEHPVLGRWRTWLYMQLAANALSPARFYCLPPNRVTCPKRQPPGGKR